MHSGNQPSLDTSGVTKWDRAAEIGVSLLPLFPIYLGIRLSTLLINCERLIKFPLTCYAFVRGLLVREGLQAFGDVLRKRAVPVFLLTTLIVFRIASSFASRDVKTSLFNALSDVHTWVLFVVLGVLFGKTAVSLERVIYLLTRTAIIVAVISVGEWMMGRGIIAPYVPASDVHSETVQLDKERDGRFRSQASFTHPLMMAHYLVMFLPFVGFQASVAPTLFRRVAWFAAVSIMWMGIYGSGSRIGVFLATAECAALGLLIVFNMFYRPTALKLLVSGTLFAGFAVAGAYLGGMAIELLQGRTYSETSSSLTRMRQSDDALPAIQANWLLGVGAKMSVDFAGVTNHRGVTTIDSFYLSFALESGLVAVTAFAGLVLWCVFTCLVRSIKSVDPVLRNLYATWLISLVGFAVFAAFLSIQDQVHQYFYLFLGQLCCVRPKAA